MVERAVIAQLPGMTGPASSQAGFRGPQVCKLIGITYRQLDYWARTGLLRPSINDARGSGTQRMYSYHDVLELKVIKQLLDAGVSLQRARRAVQCLRDELREDLASANLVLVGPDSVLAHGDGEVVDLLRGGQGVLNVVPLSGVVSELDAAILQFDAASAADHGESLSQDPAATRLPSSFDLTRNHPAQRARTS